MIGQRAGARKDSGYNRQTKAHMALKSEAEIYYYRIFKEKFPETSFEKLGTRWRKNSPRPNRISSALAESSRFRPLKWAKQDFCKTNRNFL